MKMQTVGWVAMKRTSDSEGVRLLDKRGRGAMHITLEVHSKLITLKFWVGSHGVEPCTTSLSVKHSTDELATHYNLKNQNSNRKYT